MSSSLDYRPVTLLIVAALLGAMVFMFLNTTTELAPEEDEGALFSIMNGPRYATLDYTKLYTDRISELTGDIAGGHDRVLDRRLRRRTNSGLLHLGAEGLGRARALARARSSRTSRAGSAQVAGVEAFVFAPPSLPGAGGGLPITVVIQSIGDPTAVYEVAEEIKNKAQATRPLHRRAELARLRRAAGRASPSTATAPPRSASRSARSARR